MYAAGGVRSFVRSFGVCLRRGMVESGVHVEADVPLVLFLLDLRVSDRRRRSKLNEKAARGSFFFFFSFTRRRWVVAISLLTWAVEGRFFWSVVSH